MRSASGKGVLSEERWNRMHCRRTGRHFCCGEKNQTSISGGHVNERIKNYDRRANSMNSKASEVYSLVVKI